VIAPAYEGATFASVSTDEDLKALTELFDWPGASCRSPTRSTRRDAPHGAGPHARPRPLAVAQATFSVFLPPGLAVEL
jgi:hypothetical protein